MCFLIGNCIRCFNNFGIDLGMQVLNLILKDLRVIVTDVVYDLGTLLKDVGMSRIPNLKQFVLLLHKDTIVYESPPSEEIESVTC